MSTGESCPLCGRTKGMNHKKLLYGYKVCKKCRNGFANRRQFAFFIDSFLIQIAQVACVMVVAAVLPSSGGALTLTSYGSFIGLLLVKDSFAGCSPGKAMMGVQAVNRETYQPIGLGRAAARNLPVLIPFMPLIIGSVLLKGFRIGDGWAKSKVIWRKYADNPVFTGQPLPQTTSFGPATVSLPPIQSSDNPYQAPRL